MSVSAAVLAQMVALFLAFLKVMANMLSMRMNAFLAVLAKAYVL
jgi:hypothetical protein